ACYERTTELAPAFAEAQTQLGTLYLTKKRAADKAIERFRIALTTRKPYADERFTPKHTRSQSLQNMAVAYATRGEEGVGVAIAQSYLADPDVERERDRSMNALVARAGAALAQRTKPALSEQLSPIRKKLHSGAHKEALEEYEKLAKEHPESELVPIDAWELHEGIALAHAFSGDAEGGAKAFEKSVADSMKLGAR